MMTEIYLDLILSIYLFRPYLSIYLFIYLFQHVGKIC